MRNALFLKKNRSIIAMMAQLDAEINALAAEETKQPEQLEDADSKVNLSTEVADKFQQNVKEGKIPNESVARIVENVLINAEKTNEKNVQIEDINDMIGNEREWCLDKWQDAANLAGGENPVSTTYASGKDGYHVQRGAGITTANESHVVTYRIARHKDWSGTSTAGDGEAHGVRLCIYCDLHDDGTK